jgi:TrmH family RNA methyltransferase
MKVITSPDNKKLKTCQRLGLRKYRDRTDLYLAEGPNLLQEALAVGSDIREVFVEEGSQEAFESLLETLRDQRPKVEPALLDKKLFSSLAQTEASQGILTVLAKPHREGKALEEILDSSANLVVLDRLQDPGNIGTIIRTAEGAGYGGILILKGTGDVFAPKVVRAAAGSLLRMPLIFLDTPAEAMEFLRDHRKKIIATRMGAETRYWEADLSSDIGLVVGNEGNGICRELLEGADLLVAIPMAGGLESLNAGVAAGIIMYEAMRKNKEMEK